MELHSRSSFKGRRIEEKKYLSIQTVLLNCTGHGCEKSFMKLSPGGVQLLKIQLKVFCDKTSRPESERL